MGGDFIYLLLYVDNMLIPASDLEETRRVKKQLNLTFEMKDIGAVKKILGIGDHKGAIQSKTLSFTKELCREDSLPI